MVLRRIPVAFRILKPIALNEREIRMARARYEMTFPPSQLAEQDLRSLREAALLSMQVVADRLGVSKSTYAKFEKQAESGRISVAQLREICEVIGADFALRIGPKESTADDIWKILLDTAVCLPRVHASSPRNRAGAVAAAAIALRRDPTFRAKMGWVHPGHQER